MEEHRVRVYPSAATPPRERLLAWKLAAVAADDAPLDADVIDMVVNRVLDNAGVALAGLARRPVANARAQALAHPHPRGATVFGLPRTTRLSCEWAAWANGTAVRELDFHDTFLSVDMNHPGDMIPPIVAVAQQQGCSGQDLVRAIAAAYEIAVDLAKSINLHQHRIDHILHIAAGAVGGIGALLRLPVPVIYQALNHAVHVTVTTRQSRKGEISTWKACAPAHAGKLAIEAVDRAMRGETSPAPIYEGDDSIIAWLLDGPEAEYVVRLPAAGEAKRAILDTYTKAYSAEIQAQALIDLAFRMRSRIPDLARIADVLIRTSYHTHQVIGTGSGDPQKLDPAASRETLDHSLMYIFAVALEDGAWHHVASYLPERAARPSTVALWRRIRTEEDSTWTRRYHSADPKEQAFGGRVRITLDDGRLIEDEIAVADAHPLGRKPSRATTTSPSSRPWRRRAHGPRRSRASRRWRSRCPSCRPGACATSRSRCRLSGGARAACCRDSSERLSRSAPGRGRAAAGRYRRRGSRAASGPCCGRPAAAAPMHGRGCRPSATAP